VDDKTLLKIAVDCQNMARWLSPGQNTNGIPVRPGLIGRFRRWLFGGKVPHYELPPEQITEIVNALISGGNALEWVVREHVKQRTEDAGRQHGEPA